jgi:hypothetical protein
MRYQNSMQKHPHWYKLDWTWDLSHKTKPLDHQVPKNDYYSMIHMISYTTVKYFILLQFHFITPFLFSKYSEQDM